MHSPILFAHVICFIYMSDIASSLYMFGACSILAANSLDSYILLEFCFLWALLKLQPEPVHQPFINMCFMVQV